MVSLPIRQDLSAADLRTLVRKEGDARVSRRLLAIAMALDGISRAEAARQAGMDRQTLRDWVTRYNTGGGFTGQSGIVRQWATRQRRQDPAADRAPPAKPPKAQPPTPRKAARLLMSELDKLSEDDRRFVTTLLELSPPIARAVDLARAFSTMIKQSLADQLD